jgi:hypothetical protein
VDSILSGKQPFWPPPLCHRGLVFLNSFSNQILVYPLTPASFITSLRRLNVLSHNKNFYSAPMD